MNQNFWWKLVVVVVILSVIISWITIKESVSSGVDQSQTVYNKVMKSGVMNVCYLSYPPALIKDPNTGKLSGIFYDALNKAAENMGLKTNWDVQVGWGDMIQAVNSGKCDVIGSPAWSNSLRGKSAEFSVPLYYSAINAYVRTDDYRFAGDPSVANDPQYTVVDEDGETSQIIVQRQFSNAKVITIPQTDDVSEMLLNVISNKADMAFVEATVANQFLKTHPGALKIVSSMKPVAVYGNVYIVQKGQFELLTTINNAMNELLGSGYIDQLINQYGKNYPGGFYKVAAPYMIPTAN